jgi:hypothetical protein
MRFTKVQGAMFRNGISFVHMAPNETRRKQAFIDFLNEIQRTGTYHTAISDHRVERADAFARFIVCQMNGASSEHVPVMFMDGKKSEFKDPRAYDEARYIPAKIDGVGPMVVR